MSEEFLDDQEFKHKSKWLIMTETFDSKTFNGMLGDSLTFLKHGDEAKAVLCLKNALDLKLDVFKLGIPGLKAAIKARSLAFVEFAKIVLKTSKTETITQFADSIRFTLFDQWDENVENALLICLNHASINPQDLASVSISLLKRKSFSTTNTLLLTLIKNVIVPDPNLEKFFTVTREELLTNYHDRKSIEKHQSFIYALALQCDINQYIYPVSERENELVDSLWKILVKNSMWDLDNHSLVALLACYCPLYRLFSGQPASPPPPPPDGNPDFITLFKRQILDRDRENELKSTIPILNSIEDPISQKVRHQYEEDPYPRWLRFDRESPLTLEEYVTGLFPQLKIQEIQWPENPLILSAGCGTGENAIKLALRFRNSEVIAVDLSQSSLAYAKRSAEEMGVRNIQFIQGNILYMDKMDKIFDLIECSGVLHHMQDPIVGWRCLVNLLKNDAWMSIGLYSELGRKNILEAQKYRHRKGYKEGIEDIRKCRQDILNT